MAHKKNIMYTTYHLQSAQEVSAEIIEAIKTTFKNKPVKITVEEEIDETAWLTSTENNRVALNKSLAEAKRGEFIEVNPEDL